MCVVCGDGDGDGAADADVTAVALALASFLARLTGPGNGAWTRTDISHCIYVKMDGWGGGGRACCGACPTSFLSPHPLLRCPITPTAVSPFGAVDVVAPRHCNSFFFVFLAAVQRGKLPQQL